MPAPSYDSKGMTDGEKESPARGHGGESMSLVKMVVVSVTVFVVLQLLVQWVLR